MKSTDIAARLLSRVPALYLRRIREAARAARSLGLEPYLVGGVIRDLLMKRPFGKDCDLVFTGGAVGPLAEQLGRRWKLELISYPAFETHTLRARAEKRVPGHAPSGKTRDSSNFQMDLITARCETYARPAALPDVRRGTMDQDLARRDFTVNAMAIHLAGKNKDRLIDPGSGLADLKAKKIRILHDKSFSDDPTRIFRAARYAARLGFSVDAGTRSRIAEAVDGNLIGELSADRIRTEIEKILAEDKPSESIRLLGEWGALRRVSPRLSWNAFAARWFDDPVALQDGSQSAVAVRMALWLAPLKLIEAESVCDRLHFTRIVREKIVQPLEWIESFRNAGPLDTLSLHNVYPESERVLDVLTRKPDPLNLAQPWKELRRWRSATPEITGGDLQKMGIAPGPLYREILSRLREKKFRGEISGRKAEIRFVFDNYRRN